MTGLGQNLQYPHSLMIGGKALGKLPGSDRGGVWRGGAEVSSTRWRSPWVNPRRSLRVVAWNILSLREDDHLSLLSPEFQCLNIGIAALFEVAARSWQVVTPTTGLVALMVTMPKELL